MDSKKIHWGGKGKPNSILRACSETNQGMRKYMEDEVSVVIGDEDVRSAFFGVFDGHGGKEASIYARDTLYSNIVDQPGFTSDDPEKVKSAIREGFIKTHWEMFRVVESWPKRKDGQNSTSGTTATIAIIRGNKLYIAHVGDSAAVIATKENNKYVSTDLTIDHKPESTTEKSRIEGLGGLVATSNGVPRVVWKRAVKRVSPVIGESVTRYEYVPFLAVSRALGDLWSYDTETKEFIVSPEPEIKHIDLIPNVHKFIVLASDGLWGVMNGEVVVDTVTAFETTSRSPAGERNCSQILINKCLSLWQRKRSRADNISAIVVFFDDDLAVCQGGPSEEDIETDVIVSEGEDDTPPLTRANSNISLVRQIAFNTTPVLQNFKLNVTRVLTTTNEDKKPEENADSLKDENSSHKRKHGENSSPKCQQKKLRTTSPVNNATEDSHQCNVITVLSPESLCDLQLDEDLGFADDEGDDNGRQRLRKLPTTSKHTRFNNLQQVMKNVSPAVQG